MNPWTLVLADADPLMREAVRALLQTQNDFSVVEEAGGGLSAIRLIRQWQPNVLVTNLDLPRLNGLDVARMVRFRFPNTRVIVLAKSLDPEDIQAAWKSGVAGYVLRTARAAHLFKAIREVAKGRTYLSPPLSEKLLRGAEEKGRQNPKDAFDLVTHREREVLVLGAQGLRAAQVAKKLSISPRTAEVHRYNLMRKLGLKSQTELVVFAIRRGLVAVQEE